MRSQARVVVIGGGAVGCSALYHLTRLGWTDVVLLERDELTAGSTWHAAGNCPNFSTSWSILKLQRYSTTLYGRLAQEVGYDINYHLTGSIRLAHTTDGNPRRALPGGRRTRAALRSGQPAPQGVTCSR